jgi:hypothetical protein
MPRPRKTNQETKSETSTPKVFGYVVGKLASEQEYPAEVAEKS